MSEEQIPTPDTSGVSNKQIKATSDTELMPSKPLEGLSIAQTIVGLSVSHTKALGGAVPAALIAGAANQLARDNQDLKTSFEKLSTKYEKQSDELSEIKIENAVLKNTINNDKQNKHLRNFAITIGTSLIGTGIFLSRSQLDTYSYGAFGIGALLFLLGWFTSSKEIK